MSLNTLEKDDLLRRIAWLNAEVDKIKRMLKGEQMGTARIADAAITNAKISDLTWDKAQGGTAVLGGLNNVDGILSVLDNAGVEKVILDKDGVLIKSGKLVIKNDSEVISIDSKGIVSTANFVETDAVVSTPQNFSSSGDVTNATLTFTLGRTSTLLILLTADAYLVETPPASTLNATILFNVDGTSANGIRMDSGNNQGRTYSAYKIMNLGAGSHTIKLVAGIYPYGGTPYLTIAQSTLSYIILGT